MACLYTIGHSTRTLDELTGLLKAHGASLVADVRSVPRSRRNPQFNRENLPCNLEQQGIGYIHLADLGGLRRPLPESRNAGWENSSFRGYADYMQTEGFELGLQRLLQLATNELVAIMCAEAVPWRCHRSLIADALIARGQEVLHILSKARAQRHQLTPFAQVEGQTVFYPV